MPLTCLPRCVSQCLRVLGPCFRHRHPLVFSWLLVLPLGYGERATLKALARHSPIPLVSHRYRRLMCATYWCTKACCGGLPTKPCGPSPLRRMVPCLWLATAP
jgi:hypothetical protein